MPLSSPAYSPASWTGRKGWFTRSLSAGCWKRSCHRVRWNTQRLKRYAPHASSESVHTVSWKRDGSVFSRGNTLFQKTVSSAPFHLNFAGGDAAGGGMQPHTQEIPACFPLYGRGIDGLYGQGRTGNRIHTYEHHPYASGPQIHPLFGQVHHPDPQRPSFI